MSFKMVQEHLSAQGIPLLQAFEELTPRCWHEGMSRDRCACAQPHPSSDAFCSPATLPVAPNAALVPLSLHLVPAWRPPLLVCVLS